MSLSQIKTKPSWLKILPPKTEKYGGVKQTIKDLGLHTVCQEAHCPNMSECWDSGTATFMVLGDTCTRACRFCAVKTGLKGNQIDPFEPKKLGVAIKKFNLDYVVITAVDRDDLADQGAGHFASCITEIKKANPNTLVEVLTGDFQGNKELIKTIVDAKPDVFAHNIETVHELQGPVRDYRANYKQSLSVLAEVKKINSAMHTKSSIMVGLGETREQMEHAMDDLRNRGCDFLTIGQYLQPSTRHITLQEYVSPETFADYKTIAEGKGFLYCASGPFVRSSYKAGEFFIKSVIDGRRNYHAD
jgi:lipoyl synthase